MHAFVGKIVDARARADVLSAREWSVMLAELVRDTGFGRSTVVIRLERLEPRDLLLKERALRRPRFLHRLPTSWRSFGDNENAKAI
jgi:hypothetical protein